MTVVDISRDCLSLILGEIFFLTLLSVIVFICVIFHRTCKYASSEISDHFFTWVLKALNDW